MLYYYYYVLDDSFYKFYCVCNCIFSRSKGANSELTTVELLKSYCLPFLLYGIDAVTLSDAARCKLCTFAAAAGALIFMSMGRRCRGGHIATRQWPGHCRPLGAGLLLLLALH